ncbi:LIC_10190 family membrane protein, partial [Verrucomicrobiota bacterium]
MNTLRAMAAAAVFWTLLAFAFCGIGLLVRRLFALRLRDGRGVLQSFWVGWSVSLVFLQLWHLVLPVSSWALAAVSLAGALGVAWNAGDIRRLAWRRPGRTAAWAAVWMALAAWMANHSVMQPRIYDSGFYHLAAVRWISTYPIVPGLANLSQMLGFNNSSFLYAAMLDAGPFAHRSHHVASGLIILFGMLQCLHGVDELVRAKGGLRPRSVFDALFLVPLTVWAVNTGYASTASPDV